MGCLLRLVPALRPARFRLQGLQAPPGCADDAAKPGAYPALADALADRRREHDHEVSRLQGRIAELERELQERPEKIVERWHGTDEIEAARAEAQRAFRSRENAWEALCEIRLLHREASDGKCRCGRRYSGCPEAQIVGYYPGLADWEKEQWERYRNYQDHALPDNHPALVDPRWRPD